MPEYALPNSLWMGRRSSALKSARTIVRDYLYALVAWSPHSAEDHRSRNLARPRMTKEDTELWRERVERKNIPQTVKLFSGRPRASERTEAPPAPVTEPRPTKSSRKILSTRQVATAADGAFACDSDDHAKCFVDTTSMALTAVGALLHWRASLPPFWSVVEYDAGFHADLHEVSSYFASQEGRELKKRMSCLEENASTISWLLRQRPGGNPGRKAGPLTGPLRPSL